MFKIKQNKVFYMSTFALMLPIILQQLLSSLAQLVDNFMVGRLGSDAIAGVYTSNQIFMIYSFLIFGFTGGVIIFLSQYHGANDDEHVGEAFRFSLWGSVLLGLVTFIIISLFAHQIINFFSNEEKTIQEGLIYLKYIKWTFVIFGINSAISFSYRAIGMPKISLVPTTIAIFVNTILNAILINGLFFFPRLGVEGAAIATLVARIVELIVSLIIVQTINSPIKIFVKRMFYIEKFLVLDIIKRVYPLIANELLWASSQTLMIIFLTNKVTINLAAINISATIANLLFVAMGGLGSSISIIVGSKLGANKITEAKEDAKRILRLAALIGISAGILVAILAIFVPNIYNVSKEVKHIARLMLLISGSFAILYYVNASIFFIFRSGGDVKSVILMDSVYLFVVTLPVAYSLNKFTKLDMPTRQVLVQLTEIIKFFFALFLFTRYRWAKNLTITKTIEK